MDNQPVTANSLGRLLNLDGKEIERYYKWHLNDFKTWNQADHATDWMLLIQNIGENPSIDETQLCEKCYTILSNKAGKGKKGSLVAIVKGTKSSVVSKILRQIPDEERLKVKEITMDFSDSMYAIANECFPNARIVIDCFHIVQRLYEGLEEMRLRFKRLAVTENKKAEPLSSRTKIEKPNKGLTIVSITRRTQTNTEVVSVSIGESIRLRF